MKFLVAACCVLAFLSSLGTCDIITVVFDEAVYIAAHLYFKSIGESDVYTKCVVELFRSVDGAAELRKVENYTTSKDMWDTLMSKKKVANFLCRLSEFFSPIPLKVVFSVTAVLLCLSLFKIWKCLRSKRKSVPDIPVTNVNFIISTNL